MRLPSFLAKPIFHAIYTYMRRKEGAIFPPTRRKVMPVDAQRKQAFDILLDTALAGDPRKPIHYNLGYPKTDFLNYICEWRGFVVHGSPSHDLETLQPIRIGRDNNQFGHRQQIFCSPDAIWAMWFAILDKSKYNQTRNFSVRVGSGPGRVKYYHFELPKENWEKNPFTEGMMYIARAQDFPRNARTRLWIGSMARSKNGAVRRLSHRWQGYAYQRGIFPISIKCSSRFNALRSCQYPVYYYRVCKTS